MQRLIAFTIILFLAGQSAWANHTAMIGGMRDGLAMGLEIEEHLSDNLMYRFGLEASTGEDISFTADNPFVLTGGGRFRLGKLGFSPMWGGVGVVGNFGNNTEIGVALSLIFEKIYNQDPLFLETGLDWFTDPGHGHVQIQVGYRFIEAGPI